MQTTRNSGRRGTVPAYIQVAHALRRRIEVGDWSPGSKISTLEELEQEFDVARVTVRQAVDLLEREGLVRRQQGRGTFVNDTIDEKRWLTLHTSWDGVLASIEENVPKFIKVDDPPAKPRLRGDEGLLAPKYAFLRSVQAKEGVPFAVVNVHIAKPIFDSAKDRFTKRTALPVLASLGLDLADARQSIVIGTADPEIAQLLHISLSAPTAEVRWVVRDRNNVAVYVGEITYRADCIKMSMDYSLSAESGSTQARRRKAA